MGRGTVGNVLQRIRHNARFPPLERKRGAGGARQRERYRSGSNFYCDTWSYFSTIYFSNFFPHLTPTCRPGYRPASSGSNVVSELVALARPRYHVAGGEALHYVRPPFAHRDLGAGIRVTRFVGLAPLNHPSKAKVRFY